MPLRTTPIRMSKTPLWPLLKVHSKCPTLSWRRCFPVNTGHGGHGAIPRPDPALAVEEDNAEIDAVHNAAVEKGELLKPLGPALALEVQQLSFQRKSRLAAEEVEMIHVLGLDDGV